MVVKRTSLHASGASKSSAKALTNCFKVGLLKVLGICWLPENVV